MIYIKNKGSEVMEAIDMLWELESHWNFLESYENELKKLNNDLDLKTIEKKATKLEKKLQSSENKQEKIKKNLRETEKELDINNFNMEELKRSLYDGHTSDIKQLEYLNKEKEKIEKIIDNIELKVLDFIGKTEDQEKEIKSLEKELKTVKDEDNNIKNSYRPLIENLENKIKDIKNKISIEEEKLEESLIKEYNRIRKSRGTGIVVLRNSVCMGCNIMLPTLSAEKVKDTKEIFQCESCGRILYQKE